MDLKKLYKPHKEFKERSKIIFLSAFRSKFPGAYQRIPAFRYFIRGAAFGAAFVIILTAGATYADQKNVGATSVLYPLKRTSELVKVVFTNQSEKTEIHLELAERRLEEIKEVREKNPENPKLESLSKDLEKEIHNSILKVEFPKSQQKANQAAKTNLEMKFENKSENLEAAGASPAISASQITAEDSKSIEVGNEDNLEKEVESLKERERTFERKDTILRSDEASGLSDRQRRTCEFWKEIIEEEDSAVTDLVNKTPEIIRKFNENCESFFGSVIIKTDSSEVEVEIEG